jgi:mono/diheme cytochrome c family protein
MKKLKFIFLAIITITLSACNITLAADVTPPPNYVAPTAIATLGAVYPSNQPDIANGKIIFAEKCAPCHGDLGLGDGEQGKQLPVSVIPIGLPEIANQASPAKWYSTVTQGNIERFMPPFASLSEQEKWDVVTYAFTLHTTPKQIELGKNLFENNCNNCENQFTNLESMSALSDADLIKQIQNTFGADFTEAESYAVAKYIRTLTFAPPATVTIDSTPEAQSTPQATEQVEAENEAKNITGQIENLSNQILPSDLQITLRGFQHGADPNAGTQEIFNQSSVLDANGNYAFENTLLEGQIYFVQFELDGLNYQTEITVVKAGEEKINLPTLTIYESTEDFSALQIDSLEIFFDLANLETAQIFSVYTFTNSSDKTIIIKLENETVPFIAFPQGATGLGYEATQDSAVFIPSADGFAIPPSEKPYGLIAFASIPQNTEIQISQPALLNIASATLLLPEGVNAEGSTLTDQGTQAIQNNNFHIYSASAFAENTTLEFTLIGKPIGTTETANPLENQNIVLGIGVFGIALIFAGVWMYLKNKKNEDEEDDDEFEDASSIMDAIIALDDLHKDGKISEEAYRKRRDELKSKLKHEA